MRALTEAVEKHHGRIAKDVRAALVSLGIPRPYSTPEALTEALLEGVMRRVRVADDGRLSEVLRECLEGGVAPGPLAAALVRLAAAMRKAVLGSTRSKQVAMVASGGIDRAVAEALEEVELPAATRSGVTEKSESLAAAFDDIDATIPGPSDDFDREEPTRMLGLPRDTDPAPLAKDPTIIRNINEILRSRPEERLLSTIVAFAIDDGDPADDFAVTAREAARERCLEIADRVGATVILDQRTLVACALAAGVNASDVEEGVSLALELARLGDGCAVGLARGEIWMSDPTEADGRRLAFGEAVTRAIALAGSSVPGEVRCDEAIQRAAGETWVLRAAPPALLPYRLDPDQPQWVDRWEQASFVVEAGRIGNDEALRALKSALRAPTNKISVIGVRGRAGAGKWALVTAALDEMEINPDRVLVGQPHAASPAPYWPLLSIARKVLELDDAPLRLSTLKERVERLAAKTASTIELAALLPALATLFGVEDAGVDGPMVEELEPAAMRTELAKALLMLLEAAADQEPDRPLIVALREMQETDLPTSHAFSHVLRNYDGAAQLVVVLTYRGTFRPPPAMREVGYTRIDVERLPGDDLARLGRAMLDQEDLPAGLENILRRRSDGLPMMARMLVRHLVETGLLQRSGGLWRFESEPKASDLPRRLPQLIRRRIQQLPANLAGMLKSAATVGEDLPWRILELVWVSRGIPLDDLQRSTSLLQEMGFLRPGQGSNLRFSHPLVREVAYKMQTETERREAHRLVAVAYGESYPDAVRQMPVLLFHHFSQAGDEVGARQAGVLATRRAMLLHDHKQGLKIASTTLPLCEGDSRAMQEARFELLEARERILDARSSRKEQRRDLRDLELLARTIGGKERLGTVLHRVARLELLTGNLGHAREAGESAIELLEGEESLDLSNALRTVALIRWTERDPPGAVAALRRALQIYERLGHQRGMGFVLHNLGMFSLDSGAVAQARECLERALAIKESTNDEAGRAAVLDGLGRAALLEGNHRAAAEKFEQAIAARRADHDPIGAAASQLNLGDALLPTDPTRAEALARDVLKALRRKKMMRTKIEANLLLARALLAQSKRRAAARPAKAAAEKAREVGAQVLTLRAELVLAEHALQYDDKKRAEQAMLHAENAATNALNLGAMRWRIEALSLQALATHPLDEDEARRIAREALATLGERTYAGLDHALITERCRRVLEAAPS